MKASILITLIITGGVLIVAPMVSDYAQRKQVAATLGQSGSGSVYLGPALGELYRFGCWLVGSAMIGAAIASLARNHNKPCTS